MGTIRLVIADDLNLIRHGLRAMFAGVDEIEIVADTASVESTVQAAAQLKPDVILVDEDMPGDSIGGIPQMKQLAPGTEIIVMADRLDDTKALRAIEAGATGYILKDIPKANLTAALRSVCNGRGFFHPEVTRKLMERLARLSREQRARMRLESEGLTERELDVIMELAKGSTDREIAEKFVVAEGTIKTHIHNILRKLGVRNRTQAVAFVLRKGLID